MKITKKYVRLLAALLVAFVVAYGIYSVYFHQSRSLSQAEINELRSQYPVYSEHPFYMEIKEPKFGEVLKLSDAVILAEIVEELPEYTVELAGDSGTPEGQIYEKGKEYGLSANTKFVQYRVKVLEPIAYNSEKAIDDGRDIVISYSSEFKDYMPKLKPGMRIIVPIKKGTGQHDGKYLFTQYSLYYVIQDQYVLSAYPENDSISFTGKTVAYTRQKIKEIYSDN